MICNEQSMKPLPSASLLLVFCCISLTGCLLLAGVIINGLHTPPTLRPRTGVRMHFVWCFFSGGWFSEQEGGENWGCRQYSAAAPPV